MNSITLIGNFTRDPELYETESGKSVAKAPIAVNRKYVNADGEREADFFNLEFWNGSAETIAKYCKKGNKIAIKGSLEFYNWTDEDGVIHYTHRVSVNDFEFLTPKAKPTDQENKQQGLKKKSVNRQE